MRLRRYCERRLFKATPKNQMIASSFDDVLNEISLIHFIIVKGLVYILWKEIFQLPGPTLVTKLHYLFKYDEKTTPRGKVIGVSLTVNNFTKYFTISNPDWEYQYETIEDIPSAP
jgi:hypothetical protein